MKDSSPPDAGKAVNGRRRWFRYLLEVLIILVLFAALRAWQTRDVVAGPAPVFDAVLLDGAQVSLAQYRGRPLLLHFWASWCPVCRLEQDSIGNIARDHAVLTVSIDDMAPGELRAWMTEQGLDYPVVPDPSGRLSARYGVRGVPTSIVIDAEGRIRFTEVGYTTEAGLRLRLWWAGR